MNATGHTVRHRRGSPLLASVVSLVLVAACATATSPTPPAPTATVTGSPSPSLVPASASTSPTASPDPARIDIPVGAVAVTASDRLRVRSAPSVSDDSALYTPLLPIGAELLVLQGPVAASGYWWYRIRPVSVTLDGGVVDGWVAAADHDGTAWLAPTSAPIAGIELARSVVARAAADPAGARQAAASVNAFGLDLYRRLLAGTAKNGVMSPTSIELALAMARAGARGETAKQMDSVLHAGGWDVLGATMNALDQALAAQDGSFTDDEGKVHQLALKVANAAFAHRGFPIEQNYLDGIGREFGAGVQLVDFVAALEASRTAINEWVSQQTAKRIPQLLGPLDVSASTRLVLVNAVYLKANWIREFDPDRTTARPFTRPDGSTVSVPTMVVQGEQDIQLATGRGWRATQLAYAGRDRSSPLAMVLIEPDDLAAFEAGFDAGKLSTIVSALDSERARQEAVVTGAEDCGTYPYAVRVFLPRFGVETREDLVASLDALGMPDAFSPATADFSGITSAAKLFINKVIHQANIDVDETGTEAAAATAVGIDVGGCTGPQPAKVVDFRIDHPFLFVLRDLGSGAILFVGRVVDPSAGR